MNLVDLIKDQLSSGVIKHLSSQIDASEGATRSAVSAAVPALLAGTWRPDFKHFRIPEARLSARAIRLGVDREPGP